ncbi:MAG: TIR domain-containing protein [Candidatus Poribacteria bacterium]|nr:TIR domain-containing protein [Candidatus Poribacteria bacterium]MDE0502704.1 TIR domain-containing protein [Candidatus Poribacteria bacterium]
MREFDVTLSFAGEDRKLAEDLAKLLDTGGYSVFYDEFERARLWGKNLYQYLASVYQDKARYCVIFLSRHYLQSSWAQHELQNAQARAFVEQNKEYILPIRIDDTKIPGILSTVGHLDLSKVGVEDVYQHLVEKLSGSQSRTSPNEELVPSPLVSESKEFALLRPGDNNLYFIPFQEAQWNSTEISLGLLPESSEESAFLRSLRDDLSNMFSSRQTFAFALGQEAAWVSPQEIAQTMSGTKTVWKVVLKRENPGQNDDLFGNVTFSNLSPDRIAELRARRILLDEKLEAVSSALNQVDLINQATLDSFIRGTNPSLEIRKCPIPDLYRSFGQTWQRFEKFARLVAVLFLKLSNTVQDVLEIDFKFLDANQLQVRFRGRRPRYAVNATPSIIEVNGICPL